MNNPILIIAVTSITIGLIIGAIIVWLIYLTQRNQNVDSLIRIDRIVGNYATVEIPFNPNTKGKVRINIKNSQVDFIAFTDEQTEFQKGDTVFIVAIKQNKVWVISQNAIAK